MEPAHDRPRIVLSHPVRQHAHRLAGALNRADMLQRMYTLFPGSELVAAFPSPIRRLLERTFRRWGPLGLPPGRVRSRPLHLIVMKASQLLGSAWIDGAMSWWTWQLFDKWVSRNLESERPDIVIGYEIGCARTFLKAKEIGALCILDAAAMHYTLQDRVLPQGSEERPFWAKATRAKKDQEIQLADRIICVSEFAADLYRQAGVPPEKIVVNPLGCDVRQFAPARKATDATARFCFVGTPSNVKGTSVLLGGVRPATRRKSECRAALFRTTDSADRRGRQERVRKDLCSRQAVSCATGAATGGDGLPRPALARGFLRPRRIGGARQRHLRHRVGHGWRSIGRDARPDGRNRSSERCTGTLSENAGDWFHA